MTGWMRWPTIPSWAATRLHSRPDCASSRGVPQDWSGSARPHRRIADETSRLQRPAGRPVRLHKAKPGLQRVRLQAGAAINCGRPKTVIPGLGRIKATCGRNCRHDLAAQMVFGRRNARKLDRRRQHDAGAVLGRGICVAAASRARRRTSSCPGRPAAARSSQAAQRLMDGPISASMSGTRCASSRNEKTATIRQATRRRRCDLAGLDIHRRVD